MTDRYIISNEQQIPFIEYVKVPMYYQYVWLKGIVGVDLTKHCAKCLIGKYSKQIDKYSMTYRDIVLQDIASPFYYLCGVKSGYNYDDNLHIAFRYKKDSIIDINIHDFEIKIMNAEQMEFNEDDINHKIYHDSVLSEYRKCRNYQFAHWLYKYIKSL